MPTGRARRADDRRRGNVGSITVQDPAYDAVMPLLDKKIKPEDMWNDRRIQTPHGRRAK